MVSAKAEKSRVGDPGESVQRVCAGRKCNNVLTSRDRTRRWCSRPCYFGAIRRNPPRWHLERRNATPAEIDSDRRQWRARRALFDDSNPFVDDVHEDGQGAEYIDSPVLFYGEIE